MILLCFTFITIFGGSSRIDLHELSILTELCDDDDSSEVSVGVDDDQYGSESVVMSCALLINFSQFVMLAVDKYDKYTSLQIHAPLHGPRDHEEDQVRNIVQGSSPIIITIFPIEDIFV